MKLDLPSKASSKLKIPHYEPNAVKTLTNHITTLLQNNVANRRIVVVCIGTDRSTGDSLGPIVGSALETLKSPYFDLYGTLNNPVHAMNLDETIIEISKNAINPFIIGIDACLGQAASVGCIQVGLGPVKPGAGVNRNDLPPIGDIHINGIVNVGGFMEYFVLQNTRLSLVMKMAEIISECLHSSIMTFMGHDHV